MFSFRVTKKGTGIPPEVFGEPSIFVHTRYQNFRVKKTPRIAALSDVDAVLSDVESGFHVGEHGIHHPFFWREIFIGVSWQGYRFLEGRAARVMWSSVLVGR